jgi:hypothetical protein
MECKGFQVSMKIFSFVFKILRSLIFILYVKQKDADSTHIFLTDNNSLSCETL